MSATADKSQPNCPKCGVLLQCGRYLAGQCLACLLDSAWDEEEVPTTSAERFDHYQVATHSDGTPVELGRGAMGITFRASDTVLGNDVALKVIDTRIAAYPEARERFLREARAAARLRHPNVASVFYYGVRKSDGQCFYAMELVEGETLVARLRRVGPLPTALALEVIAQVARALVAAEAQALVHRDLKPANLMLVNGPELTVKVIDFGLAKAAATAGSETDLTHGGFVGTPAFASPERFTGSSVDVRSDLYSLGITLWEMLTGQTPFRGDYAQVMYQHQNAPLPLGQLEGIPQPVVVLVEILLEKDPVRRFQNPTALLKAMAAITGAIDGERTITHQSLRNMPPPASGARWLPARLGPERISVARLPITGSDMFGREEDIAFLDDAWTNQDVNVVTIVAWAGVGKSTLVNHWLRRMATDHYRSAELVFGWSFYRQGSSGGTASADEFLDAALTWFGDPDPRLGTAWEKGGRLAKLVAHRRTLLVLDGLEPLQNPPGPREGRIREPALQALLRELAAFNTGICVVTTRMPVADIADHEGTSALRCDLEQLSSAAGATLLEALGVKGPEAELRNASNEFSGHSFALTLLGSYLTDAFSGDIRRRSEVSGHLAHDVRQGAHARKVMESYQTWLGESPELSVLRMLGLFDRPADEKTLGVLLKSPVIPGLTESLTDLRPTEWRTILARLRRARLLAGEDPHNPGQLDTHPLVREYFGEQLRSQQTDAWKECNRRLFYYYRTLAPRLPNSFREMEPLFLAVICGCNSGLLREALHEIYIPRIQRGNDSFAANVLGARGPLLSALVHFFEDGRWGSPVETNVQGQSLNAEDQLFILLQAARYLTATRGFGAPEACICYQRAEPLCHSLNRPRLLAVALMGQCQYSLITDTVTATLQIAKRFYSLAQEQNDARLMMGAYRVLAGTLFYLGDFECARQYAMRAVQIWRSGSVQSHPEDLDTPVVGCLCYQAKSEWHLGEIASSKATIAEAISVAKKLNDMHTLASALHSAAILGYYELKFGDVVRLASDLIELSTRHNFVYWLARGIVFRGWACSALGETAEGVAWIEQGIKDLWASGLTLDTPSLIAFKAEALYLADRTSEALEVIREAEAMAERSEERFWCAEVHRLRGVFLAAMGADETQIEASYCEAIRIAKEQKSISLATRAEASYAAYRRQKASTSERGGFRLPLW
jgi:serine/threonine protein kinase/tetratricopeptide (TPR) repeat protein